MSNEFSKIRNIHWSSEIYHIKVSILQNVLNTLYAGIDSFHEICVCPCTFIKMLVTISMYYFMSVGPVAG